MLALSRWTWVAVGTMLVVAFGFLIPAIIGLIRRLKELKRTLEEASGGVNEAMESMRADLDLTQERLMELRAAREGADSADSAM